MAKRKSDDWLDEQMIVIGAFRYYLGRRTISVGAMANWLVSRWHKLDDRITTVIKRDLEEAFEREQTGYLGDECDRYAWSKVRALYRLPTCVKCGVELPPTVRQTVHLDGERTCNSCNPPECYLCGEKFRQLETIINNPETRRARHAGLCPGDLVQPVAEKPETTQPNPG